MNISDIRVLYEKVFEAFRRCFDSHTVSAFCDIFAMASSAPCQEEQKYLQESLLSLIEYMEKHYKGYDGLLLRAVSPSKKSHIIVVESECYFVDIYGIRLIMSSTFSEGEATLANFEWYEESRAVIFDIVDTVCRQKRKCVCCYDREDFKVGFTQFAR